jgi:predicted kinase
MTSGDSPHPPAWTFPFCPRPPDWRLDWQAIEGAFPWVRAMANCRQDPRWHAEGDVLVHTRMVCEALVENDAWKGLPGEDRSALFAAALMHDIAKPHVTIDEAGEVRAPRHASRGTKMARWLLWREILPDSSPTSFGLRERIVGLVRHHGLPLYLLDEADPQRAVAAASLTARLDHLALLAQADALGRRCADQRELLGRIELFCDSAREHRCLASPRPFASAHTRFLYFQGRALDPDLEAYDDTRMEAVVLSGLPGAGKDRWIARHAPELPVVSLDAIRQRLAVPPEDEQGSVLAEARRQARAHLRRGQPFAWNATNVTQAVRRQVIGLLRDYHARVRIVYVETAWEELVRRNRSRAASVPRAVLERLAAKLEVPTLTEAHEVEYHVT